MQLQKGEYTKENFDSQTSKNTHSCLEENRHDHGQQMGLLSFLFIIIFNTNIHILIQIPGVVGEKLTSISRKIHGCVKLPTKLNMRPFMAPIAADENIGDTYSLFGVVVHEGECIKSGHYKAYVKTQIHNDIWFECNDQHVELYQQNISDLEGFIMFYMRYIYIYIVSICIQFSMCPYELKDSFSICPYELKDSFPFVLQK